MLGLIDCFTAGRMEVKKEKARPNDLLPVAEQAASDDVAATGPYLEMEVIGLAPPLRCMYMKSQQSEKVVGTKQEHGCEEACPYQEECPYEEVTGLAGPPLKAPKQQMKQLKEANWKAARGKQQRRHARRGRRSGLVRRQLCSS